jgi:sec-independent protein translocase protein TatA
VSYLKKELMILTFLLLGLGTTELIVILLVILLLFGAKRIPDLMKSMGKGVKSFKAGMKEVEDEINAPDKSADKNESVDGKDQKS